MTKLTTLSNQELLERFDKLVRSERKLTHVILCHIHEVESRRLYAELGFESMFKYLTRHCGYGEDSAYRRLQAARLLKNTPEIAEKLEEGSLNLTQLTQVQRCLKEHSKKTGLLSSRISDILAGSHAIEIGFSNGREGTSKETLQILEKIEGKSSYETKKVLAVAFNQPVKEHEVLKPQRDGSVRLEVTLSKEEMELLSQAKDLLSHALPSGSWAEVIAHLAKKQVQKKLGKRTDQNPPSESEIKITEVLKKKNPAATTALLPSTQSFMTARKRTHLRITTRRLLLQKAHHVCEYQDLKTGNKCESRYQLQVDHRIPLARGGADAESNLRVLCRTHNLLAAKQWGIGRT